MPKKTKADLEKELKKATKILQNITGCFNRDEDGDGYNNLPMRGYVIVDLDAWIDEAREFLK